MVGFREIDSGKAFSLNLRDHRIQDLANAWVTLKDDHSFTRIFV